VTPIDVDVEKTRRFQGEKTAAPVGEDDGFGGDTKAHYLPIEPRKPAAPSVPPPLAPPSGSVPTKMSEIAPIVDPPRSHSIAESFQDMLRQAFLAGAAAAQSGETFETWYQREVLR